LLKFLNQYANLLLVLITAIYVWLTWRNLNALQRASLRGRELRHLDDIKRYVIRPATKWLDAVVSTLNGNFPLIQLKTVAHPKPNVALGEQPYYYLRRLDH